MYNIRNKIISILFILNILSITSVQAAEAILTKAEKIEKIKESLSHLSEEFLYSIKILDHDIQGFDEDGSIIFYEKTIYSGIKKKYKIPKIFAFLKAFEDCPIEIVSIFLKNIKTKLRRAMHIACNKSWPKSETEQAEIDGILTAVLQNDHEKIKLIVGPVQKILDLIKEVFGNHYISDDLLKNNKLRLHDLWMLNHAIKFIPMVMFSAITTCAITQENLMLSQYNKIDPNIMYVMQIATLTMLLSIQSIPKIARSLKAKFNNLKIENPNIEDEASSEKITINKRSKLSPEYKLLTKALSHTFSMNGILIITLLYHIFYINYGNDNCALVDFLTIFTFASISTLLQYIFIKLRVPNEDAGIKETVANAICYPLRYFDHHWDKAVESKIRCTDSIMFHLAKYIIPFTTIVINKTIGSITNFCEKATTTPKDEHDSYEQFKEKVVTYMQEGNFDLAIEIDERKIRNILEVAEIACKDILEKNKPFIEKYLQALKACNSQTDTHKVMPESRMEILKFKPEFLYLLPDIDSNDEYADFEKFLEFNFDKEATTIRKAITKL